MSILRAYNYHTNSRSYQHIAWVYAFRFLRVSLSLEGVAHQDVVAALTQLRGIAMIARKYGDVAVGAIAATLEALIHLRDSSSAEGIEQSQRAVAAARSSQLDSRVGGSLKLVALNHLVDLCCVMQRFEPAQAMAKMQAMQTVHESLRETQPPADDGLLAVPISHTTGFEFGAHDGPVRRAQNGTLQLVLGWLPDQDQYSLAFLLSGVCIAHRNTPDSQKAENMLSEGIRIQESKSG